MWALLQWLHLIIVVFIIVGANIFQLSLRLFYTLFPFKPVLDLVWAQSLHLRQIFAFRLGDPASRAAAAINYNRSARELIEAAGFQPEDHAITTKDGYVSLHPSTARNFLHHVTIL
jgi:hypothetical protein